MALVMSVLALVVSIAAASFAYMGLRADQRAWIAPTGAVLDGELVEGSPIRLRILYENSGREPALDTVHRYGWSGPYPIPVDDAGIPYIDVDNVPWPKSNPCDSVSIDRGTGRPIYAPGKYEDIRYVFGDGAPPGLIEKTQTFLVFGCFTYDEASSSLSILETPRHKSPYCFYFQPHRDRPIQESTLEYCLVRFGSPD